jgi:hypothetical protein
MESTPKTVQLSENEILVPLVKACPSFKTKYVQELASKSESLWFSDDKFLPYIALGDFAHHVVGLKTSKQTDEFKDIFIQIEKFCTDADLRIREAATVGLLESIQNIAANTGLDPESFTPFLLPESLKYWKQLNAFWNGKSDTPKE